MYYILHINLFALIVFNNIVMYCILHVICLQCFQVGGVTSQQIAVYDEFARNIPGFLPLADSTLPPSITKPTPVSRKIMYPIINIYGKNNH